MQQRDICTRAIRAEPVYLPLLPYFSAIGTGRYDPDQLTDQHVPTAAESALLVRYFNEDDPCADGFAATAAQLVPAAEPILAQEKSDIQAVEFALINRQIAWGQAAQKQQDIRVAASAKLRALGL